MYSGYIFNDDEIDEIWREQEERANIVFPRSDVEFFSRILARIRI